MIDAYASLKDEDGAREEYKARISRAYQELFLRHPSGKAVLADLMSKGGVLMTSHEPGDPYSTAFNEGRRVTVLEILGQLRWTEGEALHMALQRKGQEWDPFAAPGDEPDPNQSETENL
jgi:hypothetical protein